MIVYLLVVGAEKSNLQVMVENPKSPQINNNSVNNLVVDTEPLPTVDEFDEILSSNYIINENENIVSFFDEHSNVTGGNAIYLPFHNIRGQKRSFEDSIDSIENNKRSDSSNDLLLNYIMELKQKYVELESKITQLENGSMPPAGHLHINQNSMEPVNFLRDEENTDVGEKISIVDIVKILKIDANKLLKCNGKTSTATARSVIKAMYPNPRSNFRYRDVDKSIVDSIINYTKLSNPNDKVSDAERRRAVSNYFSYLTHRRKIKEMIGAYRVASELKKDDNNTTSASSTKKN
ncbi:unnamed protein product [Rotaria sp. Silwood2]|nr:unnamed protein product [Rotaria sp. Silwood2]CAF4082827.1 unnamed protein product [Rotaria sp. Silwood2]